MNNATNSNPMFAPLSQYIELIEAGNYTKQCLIDEVTENIKYYAGQLIEATTEQKMLDKVAIIKIKSEILKGLLDY